MANSVMDISDTLQSPYPLWSPSHFLPLLAIAKRHLTFSHSPITTTSCQTRQTQKICLPIQYDSSMNACIELRACTKQHYSFSAYSTTTKTEPSKYISPQR